MKHRKVSITQLIRHGIQIAAFLLFPGLFISTWSAVGSVVTALVNGTFSLTSMADQLVLILAVFPITIIWGRFFCGYLCSFGAMGDLVWAVSSRVHPRKVRTGGTAGRILRFVRFIILTAAVIFLWIPGRSYESSLSPWNVFGMLTSGNLTVMLQGIATVGMVLLVLIVIGSAVVERFFCRYLCPLGAIFSLVSGWRLFRIHRKERTCVHCHRCAARCSMGLPVDEASPFVSSGDCIDCMECMTVCPNESLTASPAPALAGTTAALATAGLVTVGQLTVRSIRVNASSQTAAAAPAETTDEIIIGTTTGSAADSASTASGSSGASAGSDSTASTSSQASTGSSDQEPTAGTTENNTSADSENASESSDSGSTSAFTDGTYTGSGEGFRGTTEVQVTVSQGKITDITILSYEDNEEFFSRAESTVIQEILDQQSLDVTPVSGATFSSNGIIKAVADALDVTVSVTEGSTGHGGHGPRG